MESDQLIAFFRRGFIPGPQETEEAFLKRIEDRSSFSSPDWQEVAPQLLNQWGFSLDWVPILYSSKKLLPWEGAVYLIQENGQPLIQLRPSLQTKKLWGNSRSDILLHEAIHAARESFDEPEFEEFLAYSTSSTCWKRWLGPLFQRPWDFPLLALAIFLLPLIPFISSSLLALFLGKSLYKHYLFHRVKKQVSLSVLLCLTDREIKEKMIFKKETLSQTPTTLRHQLMEALRGCFKKR